MYQMEIRKKEGKETMAKTKTAVNSAIRDLWREKLDICELKKRLLNRDSISTMKLIEATVQTVYCGTTPNGVQFLNEGLDMETFSPILVVESITKLPLGRKYKCFVSALDVIDKSLSNLRYNSGNDSSLTVCKTISRGTFWILENTIETYKLLYTCLKDNLLSPDPENLIDIVTAAQKLLKKLIFTSTFCNLNFIGKLSFGEEFSALQVQAKELFFSLSLDKINTTYLYNLFENNLKEFMNCITRFLNTSPMFLEFERPQGQIPSQQIFTFIQFQVLEYLSISCKKITDIADNWLKVENIPVDQAFVDFFRFSIHNILVRNDQFEQTVFVGFMLLKLPSILYQLHLKYTQQNSEQSVIIAICQRLATINFDDVNAELNCDVYRQFIAQCQLNRSLDAKQAEQLTALHPVPTLDDTTSPEGNTFLKLLAAVKKHDEVLNTLALSLEENREVISQEMAVLITSPDLNFILTTLACTDNMKNFVLALLRINAFAERCPAGTKDVYADLRADLFNNSFLLLTYTGTKFGDEVFIDVENTYDNSFFTRWRRHCTDVTSRKLYNQTILDQMMEPIPTSYTPQNLNAQWDEYCWCVGMIIKELTQAHLRRHISTEDLQKVCEGFKNKRPALCICAMTWLCAQYKTMPVIERARTVKIINLFKRPTNGNVFRAAILPSILNKYSMALEPDLQATKNKSAITEQPRSAGTIFTSILTDMCPPNKKVLLDQNILRSIRRWHAEFGIAAFAESIVKLILNSGKEEEAKLYEELCTCLVLMEPMKILKEIFVHVLKKLFHCPTSSRAFSDPQGMCLARCISRSFVTALVLLDGENKENTATPRTPKMQKLSTPEMSNHEKLVNFFATFLDDSALILSVKKKCAVSTFILNLIEQVAMATSLLKPSLTIDETVAARVLEQLPSTMSRDTITMLCNLASVKGQDTAAQFLLRQTPSST